MVEKADKIWLDGEFVNWDDANVHILTHTLHYGLGAFEGIRCYKRADGRSHVFRLNEHIRRLFDSAHLAMLKIPYTQAEIAEACKETLRINGQDEAYLRPLVFVGDGKMGLYAIDNPTRTTIASWAWGTYLGDEGLEAGIRAKVSSFLRNHPNSMLPKGKISGHYVNSILAKREVVLAGYDEAIMLDHQGLVSEASGANIFIARDGVVKTPALSSSILGGITRDSLIKVMEKQGIPIEYTSFGRDEMYLADEVFLCGTAAEVTPVREVDDRQIGNGKRGPIAEQVQRAFFDVVRGSNNDFPEWLDWV